MKKSILTILATLISVSILIFSVSAAIVVTPVNEEVEPYYLVDHSVTTYYLRNAKSGMYLDLQASAVSNGTHFQQYPFGDASEMFQIIFTLGTSMTIKTTLPYATGTKVMTVDSPVSAGDQVYLCEYNTTGTEQKWVATQNENGSYCISPESEPEYCIAVSGASTASNAKIKLVAKNASDSSQQWFIDTVPDSSGVNSNMIYYVRNKASGKYLDLQGNGTTNGTHFQQYPFGTDGYPSEQFKISQMLNGYYTVRSMLATSAMVMDGGDDCSDGDQVILYQQNSNALEQRWHFKRNSDDGTFCISPAADIDVNLAVQNSSSANNAKVIVEERNFTYSSEGVRIYADNQKWYLEPIDAENFGFQYMFEDEDELEDGSDYDIVTYISSGYDDFRDGDRQHCAIDLFSGNIDGQPIYAPVTGKVVYNDFNGSAGNYLVIEAFTCWPGTGKKIRLGFAHLKEKPPYNEENEHIVIVGEKIANVGNTGEDEDGNPIGYDPHLHFATFKENGQGIFPTTGTGINPVLFYPDIQFTYQQN